MSTKESPALQLGEPLLAKLTNESEEIRMRALDQVETRFIRCLQLGEMIDFKPLLLMKQLIRWFGHTPPLAADRVLAIMLELLRSDYAGVVVRKITYERLTTELGKVRRILRPLALKRVSDLLDDLQYLLLQKYNIRLDTPSASSLSTVNLTSEGTESVTSCSISFLKASLTPLDYEIAWSQPCPADVASLEGIMDMPREGETDATELQMKLTHLTIRMNDYPAEYFLQPPYTLLRLLQLQKRGDGCLLHVNRSITTFLAQLQRRIEVRGNVMSYATSLDAPGSRPDQLKVQSALGLVLNSCLDLVTKCSTSDKWHLIDLIKEAIKTYDVLKVSVPPGVTIRFSAIVKKLLDVCASQKGSTLPELISVLRIPRLQSLIFNAQLMEITILNLKYDEHFNRAHANALIQPVLLDSNILNISPGRLRTLDDLRVALSENSEEGNMSVLKRAYTKALDMLSPTATLRASAVLNGHKELCMVVNQLGSKALVKHLLDAVVQCTLLYRDSPKLRILADELLVTLTDLPDKELRWFLYGMMRKTVTNHFHAVMNKTAYISGCSNLELMRQNILGLPLSSRFLRKVIHQSWDAEAPAEVRQWCLDFFILLFKLNNFVGKNDLENMFMMILPLVPLIICRSISDTQLEGVTWRLWDPDIGILDPALMVQVYVCYLFHPNPEFRKKAIIPISRILQSLHKGSKSRRRGEECIYNACDWDICRIEPPVNYKDIFAEPSTEAFQGQRSLDALIRLLCTKDIRPAIRKSSMTQLNVMLRNWKACECFTSEQGFNMLVHCLSAELKDDSSSDILVPALSVLMKLMLHNRDFREQIVYRSDTFLNLVRALLMLPHETELRQSATICLFLMLFSDSITATVDKLVIGTQLGSLIAPVTYEVEYPEPVASPVIDGIKLQKHLDATYFGGDMKSSAQHWRLFTTEYISRKLTNEAMQFVDIRNELKMTLEDLAMMEASELDIQLNRQLMAADNCSSHDDLHQSVAVIQLFLVYMRSPIRESEAKVLWQVIHKYSRSVPVNDADCKLYMSLLDLCLSCLRYSEPHVIRGLNLALENDPNHSFLLLLNDRTVSLEMLYMVGQCVDHLLASEDDDIQLNWHGKLFGELITVARKHFDLRQLQHVRCILGILLRLSERNLELKNNEVVQYCQMFMQLSSDLRTSTQTGAQWQRDCLHIICELHMHHGPISGRWNAMCQGEATYKMLRYLLGLCGHPDGEVRALSWVLMADWIHCCDKKETYLNKLDFLPGGLPACCLTTLLDVHEMMLVRVLAGGVFIQLMPLLEPKSRIDLLRNHSFLKNASKALQGLHVSPNLSKVEVGEQHSCDVISSYVAICVTMAELDPEWWATLCEHSFMSGLSDVLKTPTPERGESSSSFLELCAKNICELYAMCYKFNFAFLQRTICRDSVLLQSFLTLMQDVMFLESPDHLLSQLFKLLLVFCKDSNAFGFLCDRIRDQPGFLLHFFLYVLEKASDVVELKRYTLQFMAMLFIKTQIVPEFKDIVVLLEQHIIPMHTIDATNIANSPVAPNTKAVASIYQILEELFIRHYADKDFTFLQVPDEDHILVTDTLGVYLKYSTLSASISAETKLFDRIIVILDTFLNDTKIGNASSYVKRVGAHKSTSIINNLVILFNFLLKWFSSHNSVIKDVKTAANIVLVLVRLWPWLSHSQKLKELTVRVVMFITEHSFEVCRQTSLIMSGQSHSLLQLMARVADFESTRKESTAGGDGAVIHPALRVMANCCSCSEGRQSMAKMNLLDIFDTILPPNATFSLANNMRSQVVRAWLGFWEIYSRYDVGAKACHLSSLMGVIRRLPALKEPRIKSLHILRNMCFFNINRTLLTENVEFVNMLRDIINHPGPPKEEGQLSFEEHRLAVLMVYRLFGFGAKYKALLRGTKLMKSLAALMAQLEWMNTTQPDEFKDTPFADEVNVMLADLFAAVQV